MTGEDQEAARIYGEKYVAKMLQPGEEIVYSEITHKSLGRADSLYRLSVRIQNIETGVNRIAHMNAKKILRNLKQQIQRSKHGRTSQQ